MGVRGKDGGGGMTTMTTMTTMTRWIAGLLGAVLGATVLGAALPGPALASVAPTPGIRLTGADISWPNCPKGLGIPSRRSKGLPMPLDSASFVVVGLTNGPGFVANPCLTDQVAWVQANQRWLAAYSLTTYPRKAERRQYAASGPWTPDTKRRQLKNAGYAQAKFNVANLAATGAEVPLVWVDVEPYPTHPWSRFRRGNRAVIQGVVRGYEDSGFRVGFYSYLNGWRTVVGDWRKPAYPTWYPVGPEPDGVRAARARCRLASFSGGPVVIGQWVDGNRDRNVTCPTLHGRAAKPHPLTQWLGTTLARGDGGPAVRDLQRSMNMRPQYVTSRFTGRTERVLLAFQRIRDLPLTGVATDVELTALGAGTTRPERPSLMAEHFSPNP